MVGRSHHPELVLKLGVFIVCGWPLTVSCPHWVIIYGVMISAQKAHQGHSLWQTSVTAALLHALCMLSLAGGLNYHSVLAGGTDNARVHGAREEGLANATVVHKNTIIGIVAP